MPMGDRVMPAERCEVAILGAGLGGLGLAARLKAAGRDAFVVFEQADRIGGTWRDNTYPGCACDIPSHLYWFSFDLQPDWSRLFPSQPEILREIERFVERHALADRIRLGTQVTRAVWDEDRARWRVATAAGEVAEARVLVAACGQLNRPRLPEIAGRDRFAGVAFHTARWRGDVELTGKRVACIGNGASAVQIIPEIAPRVAHLTVFQRSASYVVPRGDRAYAAAERALFATDPVARRASRETMYRYYEDRHAAMRLGSAKAAEVTAIARGHLEAQVADPVLRARLWPDYPIGCKRILISDDFYPALQRPNVELVTERIARIEPAGIRTADGRLHELDVIIYATGFETTAFLGPLEVVGRGGLRLAEAWRDGPRAYLGLTVTGFPNFLMLYGPNTNLGHNSIIAMLECQYDYILQALELLEARGANALEVRAEALERFNRELQAELRGSAWAAGCGSWYKTADGRITNNWPGSVEDYRARTARLALADYDLLQPAVPAWPGAAPRQR